ncbi:MAG: helix-turn-helix domain-containing protein [Pseudomonadota bacterium]
MTKSSTAKTPRRRLAPEVRRAAILDEAARIVASDGVSALSMERLGRESGVSKSLVYAYFPSMTELLRALLKRELKRLRKQQMAAAEKARTFEELVRAVTHAYLSYIAERGLLIHRLQSDPIVAEGHGSPTDYSRNSAVTYLAEIISDNFGIPMDLAMPATDISFGLPAAAGDYLDRNDIDFKMLEDLTVTMIIGSLVALEENYAVKHKELVRRRPLTKRSGDKPSHDT